MFVVAEGIELEDCLRDNFVTIILLRALYAIPVLVNCLHRFLGCLFLGLSRASAPSCGGRLYQRVWVFLIDTCLWRRLSGATYI